jgi:hypothetical protein
VSKDICFVYFTHLSRNLESSFLSVDEQGNIMPKTPEAALVAAQTYLYTTQPNPGDPREHMHQAAMHGSRLVGNKLTAKEEEAHRKKGMHKPRSPHRHNSPRRRSRVRQLGHHHQSTTKAQGTKELEDPGLPVRHTITKTMKKRWEHHALLANSHHNYAQRIQTTP